MSNANKKIAREKGTTTSKTYFFWKVLLFVSIIVLLISIAFILFSVSKTFVNYINLQNKGEVTGQIWIEISHQWWSPIKAIDWQEWQPGQSLFLTLSLFSYILLACLGLSVILVIISSILVTKLNNKYN